MEGLPRPLPKLCIRKQADKDFEVSWGPDAQLSEPGGWAKKKKKKKKHKEDPECEAEELHRHRHRHRHRPESSSHKEELRENKETVVRTLDTGLKIRISLGEPRVPDLGDSLLVVAPDDEEREEFEDSSLTSSPVKKKKRKREQREETPLKPIKLSLVSRQWTRNEAGGPNGDDDETVGAAVPSAKFKECSGKEPEGKVPPITLQLPLSLEERIDTSQLSSPPGGRR